MSTRFGSVGQHKVATSLDAGPGLVGRPDPPVGSHAGGLQTFYQLSRRVPVELDTSAPRSGRLRAAIFRNGIKKWMPTGTRGLLAVYQPATSI